MSDDKSSQNEVNNIISNKADDNSIYIHMLRELNRYFCDIQNPVIMQYVVNVVRTIKEIGDNESKVKEYIDDLLNQNESDSIKH